MGEKSKIIVINKWDKGLRFLFKIINEINEIRNINWILIVLGLEIHKSKFDIIIHDISKEDLDLNNQEAIIKDIEEVNEIINLIIK
jgi:hypothetical protein